MTHNDFEVLKWLLVFCAATTVWGFGFIIGLLESIRDKLKKKDKE